MNIDQVDLWRSSVIGSAVALQFRPWLSSDSLHGFMGVCEYSRRWPEPSARSACCELLRIKALYLLDQVHSAKVLDLRVPKKLEEFQTVAEEGCPYPQNFKADGIIVRPAALRGVALGVRTADCAPVLLRKGAAFALLHAGWRGLASGIIETTLAMLRSEAGELEAVVGPCAGGCCYEVGLEVVDAIGPAAAASPSSAGKAKLDLAATVKSRLRRSACEQVTLSGVCTICDNRFHSCRREGAASFGLNLAFLTQQ